MAQGSVLADSIRTISEGRAKGNTTTGIAYSPTSEAYDLGIWRGVPGLESGANITVGLPVVCTSVDRGTASTRQEAD
jgi:hypothetical protein